LRTLKPACDRGCIYIKSNIMFQNIVTYFEKQSFGVCTYIAERFNMSISKIRLFFIYSSFLAVGFPIVFYIMAALILDVRHYIKRIRQRIWDM